MSERPTESSTTRTTSAEISHATSDAAQRTGAGGQPMIRALDPQPLLPPPPPPTPSASSATTTTTPSLLNSTQARELPPPPRPSRSASFSNLLNPDDGSSQSRRRKASDRDSPMSGTAVLSSFKHGRHSPALSSHHHAPPPHFNDSLQQPRRLLTPRSPSLHRAASLGQINGPPATIDARQTPFLHSHSPRIPHTYTAEPGTTGIPPLPKAVPLAAPSPSSIDRRISASALQHFKAQSPSVSPRTSYIPHYGPARSSPSSTSMALPSMSAMQYNTESSGPPSDNLSDRSRPAGIPISSAGGQNVYTMMTIDTGSGTVQLPVDIQAASKVADEKRRRNAGASARFRARRKEKEKESSVTISKLETRVRNLQEDVEFYRRERGYLAGIVLQVPGGERHFPRPPSPQHRRVSSGGQASRSGSPEYMSDLERSHSPDEDRHVRRRTSTLSSVPVPGLALPTAGPPGTYGHQHYEPVPTPPHHHSHQHQHQYQQSRQHTPLPGPASLLPPMHMHSATINTQPVTPSLPAPHAGWQAYNNEQRSNIGQHGR